MKKIFIIWFFTVLFLVGLNGCCAQIWPKKVVFTPELDLAIKEQIAKHRLKSPIVLLMGDNGQLFAMDINGKTFTPCRAPRPDEIQNDDTDAEKKGREQAQENKKESEVLSRLPICEGLKDIKKIFPVENITIMTVKKNPIYKVVRTASGGLEEQCIRCPGEDEHVCD